MVIINDVLKRYHSRNNTSRIILENVSLTLPPTGFFSLIGSSGSGKTTLINIIGGIDSGYEGSVVSFGYDLSRKNELTEYRETVVGFVFQEYNLIEELTVYENLSLVLELKGVAEEIIKEKVNSVMESVGVSFLAKQFPRELSGGEKQRVAIARALVKDSKVILADEPTGNLDIENAKSILSILKDISQHRLVIMVTHNIDLALQYSNQLIHIKDLANCRTNLCEEDNRESIKKESIKKTSRYPKFLMRYPLKFLRFNWISSLFTVFILFILLFVMLLSVSTVFISEADIVGMLMNQESEYIVDIQCANSKTIQENYYLFNRQIPDSQIYSVLPLYESLSAKQSGVVLSSSIFYLPNDAERKNTYLSRYEIASSTRVYLLLSDIEYDIPGLTGSAPQDNDEIVLTDFLALMLFGTEDVIGMTIDTNRESSLVDIVEKTYRIVGIIDTDFQEDWLDEDSTYYDTFTHLFAINDITYVYHESTEYTKAYVLEDSLSDNSSLFINQGDNIHFLYGTQNTNLYSDIMSISMIDTTQVVGYVPVNPNEILISREGLEDLFPSQLNVINDLYIGNISWDDFRLLVNLHQVRVEFNDDYTSLFFGEVLQSELDIVGTFPTISYLGIRTNLLFTEQLVTQLNLLYPYRDLGFGIISSTLDKTILIETIFDQQFIDMHKEIGSPYESKIIINFEGSFEFYHKLNSFITQTIPTFRISLFISIALLVLVFLLLIQQNTRLKYHSFGSMLSIGMKKTHICWMILIESIYLTFLPFLFSLVIMWVLHSKFSQMIFGDVHNISIYAFDMTLIIVFILIFLVTILIGILPQLYKVIRTSPIGFIRQQ